MQVAAFANMNTMAKSWSSKVAENQNVMILPPKLSLVQHVCFVLVSAS